MTCLTCERSTLRGEFSDDRSNAAARALARAGFVRCRIEVATFKPFTSTCTKYAALPPEKAAARTEWAKLSQRTAA